MLVASAEQTDLDKLNILLGTPLEEISNLSLKDLLILSTVHITEQEEKSKNKLEKDKLKRKLTDQEKMYLSKINTLIETTREYRKAADLILEKMDTTKQNSVCITRTYHIKLDVEKEKYLFLIQEPQENIVNKIKSISRK